MRLGTNLCRGKLHFHVRFRIALRSIRIPVPPDVRRAVHARVSTRCGSTAGSVLSFVRGWWHCSVRVTMKVRIRENRRNRAFLARTTDFPRCVEPLWTRRRSHIRRDRVYPRAPSTVNRSDDVRCGRSVAPLIAVSRDRHASHHCFN